MVWWEQQREIAEALVRYRRVLVKAAHGVGKSHVAASLVNWHFDCFRPSITLSTAPTQSQVEDVLWKEIRTQRRSRSGLLPKAPRMETGPDHFAVGYTARNADAFQGRHAERALIVFDEAVGVDSSFWDAAEGMMAGGSAFWLALCNPTDTAGAAYAAEMSGRFHVVTVSALDHPNVRAELQGQPPLFPGAVRLSWVRDHIAEWCTQIAAEDRGARDVEFPPGSGAWYRPGPLAESRMLGRWPTQGSMAIWSEALWQAALVPQPVPEEPAVLGCDVARYGADYTSILVRRGACALHHETHNGWNTALTAGRLKQLAALYAGGQDARHVLIQIDDDGVGGGVTDQADGWNFLPVSGAARPLRPDDYPNRRSEAWFTTARRADTGCLDLSRLSPESLRLLCRQLLAPTWSLDSQGRRAVEPKEQTKARLGRSPDDADALNLAFGAATPWWRDRALVDRLLRRA